MEMAKVKTRDVANSSTGQVMTPEQTRMYEEALEKANKIMWMPIPTPPPGHPDALNNRDLLTFAGDYLRREQPRAIAAAILEAKAEQAEECSRQSCQYCRVGRPLGEHKGIEMHIWGEAPQNFRIGCRALWDRHRAATLRGAIPLEFGKP